MIVHNKEPEVSPFRLIVSTELLNEPVIACPVCGNSWIHPVSVFVAMNHTSVFAERDDATVIRSTKGSTRRGSRITINFVGKCQHQFSYAFTFHKGTTGVELINVADVPPGKFPSCLWRD
jgi:hypothetical protein